MGKDTAAGRDTLNLRAAGAVGSGEMLAAFIL
jgi:hypothetical protein